ncbi:hypothetical protein JD844_004705 [Phrynosoma platyrhinos]|uniref:FAM69 N-terminal domain-containing protein n=1 Tax=Phrynosoma platyrhinos TaxID=52577 RepID=A0ABQ7SDP9_PHRPL|nr:hypothetical protein JD844_004705 [Phrynosoma platyrhinos]
MEEDDGDGDDDDDEGDGDDEDGSGGLNTRSRLPGIKVKYLFFVWLGIFVGSWVVYMHYSSYSELCRGHACQMIIVYSGLWKEEVVIIKCGIEEALKADDNPESAPRRDSTLGDQTSLANLVNKIIAVADVSQDGKLSLAEAKSIWALLQLNDFLLTLSLHEKEHTSRLLGHCGDLYITEKIHHTSLYTMDTPQFLQSLLPSAVHRVIHQWFSPAWPRRAKIAIGLLEFVEEIFHGTYGNFYICDAGFKNVGYNEKKPYKHNVKKAPSKKKQHLPPSSRLDTRKKAERASDEGLYRLGGRGLPLKGLCVTTGSPEVKRVQ